MAVNSPRRAPNPILRITIFELSGIVLFVVLAKLLLAGMLSFFHNINAEQVIGDWWSQRAALDYAKRVHRSDWINGGLLL